MSKLEDLVPPLELCYKLQIGDFAESVFVWNVRCSPDKIQLIPRSAWDHGGYICAAPTLTEILEKLPKYDNSGVPLSCTYCVPEDAPKNTPSDTWQVGHKANNSIWDKSATITALKLWLAMSEKMTCQGKQCFKIG